MTNVVELIDVSYWEIADLEITNAADPDNLHNGILVSSTSSQRYYHLYMRSVDVHDVDCPSNSGGGGIRMDCVLSDALIDGCNVHNIGGNGIDVHSNYSWIVPKVQETYDLMADTDVTIQNCTTSYCGDSGIWKVLKRPISGKLLAALAETSPTTAAGTSLATSRLIAVV